MTFFNSHHFRCKFLSFTSPIHNDDYSYGKLIKRSHSSINISNQGQRSQQITKRHSRKGVTQKFTIFKQPPSVSLCHTFCIRPLKDLDCHNFLKPLSTQNRTRSRINNRQVSNSDDKPAIANFRLVFIYRVLGS